MTARTQEQNVVFQIQRDHGVDEESLQKIKGDPEMGRTIANLQKIVSVTTELLSNELYTKPAHCVLEILQNADDNLYDEGVEPELRIKLRADSMEIMCNEIGFQDAHVRAFCGIRQSTKKNQAGYIGEKGIGAKSIFKVARSVTIQSRGYAFELNRERKLGMITPVWVPDLPAIPGWTVMRLELADENQFSILKAQLIEIRSTVLLFLRKLNRLVIDDGTEFDVTKSLTGNILGLEARTTTINARSKLASSRYLRLAHSIATARDDEKRQGQTSTAIILAFPLKPNGEPLSAPDEMVYAFLPLRQAGFRFLLQADFLTAANREDILTDRRWNVVVRDALSAAFSAAVDVFKATISLRHTWFRFLPREHEVAHPFFAPIVKQINSRLRVLPIIWTDKEEWHVPSKCILIGPFKTMKKGANDAPLVHSQYLSCAYVSTIYAPDVRNLLGSLGVHDLGYTDFLEGLSRMHAQGAFTSQTFNWLEEVCDKILAHGFSYENQYLQNEVALRRLPLAQRQDGSWSTCLEWQVSGFFFDTSGSTFPSGISVEILNTRNLGPRHQQLLRQLGVQDINANLVVEKIVSQHRSDSVSARDVLSQLQYIFKNRQSHSDKQLLKSLWLIDLTGRRVHGGDAYMESTPAVAAELRLRSLFSASVGARLLHPSLIPEGSAVPDNREWRRWLETSLGVATAPRLKPSGLPSPELEHIINFHRVTDTSKLLSILSTYWTGMFAHLAPASRTSTATTLGGYLSKVKVKCANGLLAPLGSTYVLNESIKPFATPDLLVLPVPDITSDWSFLKHCGVTLDVNADFFLKRLRILAAQDASGVPANQVDILYRQLESRFHEQSDTIKNAFRRESLFFIGGSWCSIKHVVWDGPSILTLKQRLKPIYPHLFVLFRTHLGIPDAPDEIVADELRHFASTRAWDPLGREDVVQLQELLGFGSDTIEKVESGYMTDWTWSFREEAILPVRAPDSNEIWLGSISSDSFYVPDPSGVLAKEFAKKVAFIDLDPATIIRMHPLLARLGIYNRRIDKFVTRKVTVNGELLEDVAEEEAWNTTETTFFVQKLPLLERLYYFKMKKLFPVQSALVFDVDKLNVSYALRESKAFAASSVATWATLQDKKLLIFLSAALEPQDYHNYPVAEAIRLALDMLDEHRPLLRSILYDSDRDAEHLLKTSGIHEMPDHLRQTVEEPTEASEDEDAQKFSHAEPATRTMAPDVGLQVSSAPPNDTVATGPVLEPGRQGVPRAENVARPEVVIGTTAPEKSARQRGSPATSAVRGTRTAGLGQGQQAPRTPPVARPDAAITATVPKETVRQRGPQVPATVHDARAAEIGTGQPESPQQKRGSAAGNAGRSRVSTEDSDSRNRLEARHLKRCVEQHSLKPAVNASARNLYPPGPSPANNQWGGATDPSSLDGAAADDRSDEPEDPAAARIGYLGENFVFQVLKRHLPGFGVANWTSNVRVRGGHPRFPGVELADFVYNDTQGVLTSMLFPEQASLMGRRLEYFIEVKSTSGAASEPFHLSRRQLEQALSMTQSEDGQPGSQMFVLFRVSHIGNGEVPRIDVYADPHKLVHQGVIRVVSNAVEFRIVGADVA